MFTEGSGGAAAIVCDTTGNTVREGYCYTCLAIGGGYFGRVTKSYSETLACLGPQEGSPGGGGAEGPGGCLRRIEEFVGGGGANFFFFRAKMSTK